jgi:hypothetical protein
MTESKQNQAEFVVRQFAAATDIPGVQAVQHEAYPGR